MKDIPKRLRELAKALLRDEKGNLRYTTAASENKAIATALHEIEQAAEQRGLEQAAKWHDDEAEAIRVNQKPDHVTLGCVLTGHLSAAACIRALPTTAEPAKGA